MDQLLTIFDDKLIPWIGDGEGRRIVCMGSKPKKSELHDKVRVSRRLPRGRRDAITTKRHRHYPATAGWPRDGLIEKAASSIR